MSISGSDSLVSKRVDERYIVVSIPPTRPDILHPCDVLEDVAIACGYNNIKTTVPKSYTLGAQQPLNQLTDLLRHAIAEAGFIEVLNFALTSIDENFSMIKKEDKGTAVRLANPKTLDFSLVRTTLMAGLLKTLAANKSHVVPLRLFEIGDVVMTDPHTDVGAKNVRKISALYCGQTSGFEIIHGLVDRIMLLNNYQFTIYSLFSLPHVDTDKDRNKNKEKDKENDKKDKEKDKKDKEKDMGKDSEKSGKDEKEKKSENKKTKSSKKDADNGDEKKSENKKKKKKKKKGSKKGADSDDSDEKRNTKQAPTPNSHTSSLSINPSATSTLVLSTGVQLESKLYSIRKSENLSFFPGRSAEIVVGKGDKHKVVGIFGVVSPDVLANFEITFPCSLLELDLEIFL